VLGLAAIVSSIARPPERDNGETPSASDGPARNRTDVTTPGATPQPGAEQARLATIRFRAGAKPRTRKLEQGRPATVLVDVETPGQVDIPSLGLTQPAEPLTPARFDVLVPRAGKHPIVLEPAASDAISSKIGTLTVVPASR
jgi:hypothetical protein